MFRSMGFFIAEVVAHRALVDSSSRGYMVPGVGPLKLYKVEYSGHSNDPGLTEHRTELVSHERERIERATKSMDTAEFQSSRVPSFLDLRAPRGEWALNREPEDMTRCGTHQLRVARAMRRDPTLEQALMRQQGWRPSPIDDRNCWTRGHAMWYDRRRWTSDPWGRARRELQRAWRARRCRSKTRTLNELSRRQSESGA